VPLYANASTTAATYLVTVPVWVTNTSASMTATNTWSDTSPTGTAYVTMPLTASFSNATSSTDQIYVVSNSTITSPIWLVTDTSASVNWLPQPLTDAEQQAQRVRLEMEREERESARGRAEALLHRHLREDQRRTLKEHGWILVVSRSGNRYRIYRGRSHNVKQLDAHDREVMSLCAHPTMVVPEADCMLSQMLMLELAEDRFLAIANKSSMNRGVGRMAA